MVNKNPAYKEWEKKLGDEQKKEWLNLVEAAKAFRKKHKIRVFLVNRELKKKVKRTISAKNTEKHAKLKQR